MVASLLLLALLSSPPDVPPIDARVDAASAAFLGAPYRRSPLGEAEGIDPDPRFREDAFDCLTLVETAIALAHRSDRAQAARILDDLRYAEGEAPSFQSRLHLMEAQWIPDLIRKGYLEEVTPAHAGEALQWIEIPLDADRWRERTILASLPWTPALEGVHRIPYIPLDAAIRLAPELPAGLVVDVVREPRAGQPTQITHTGIIVVREGARYVRHAALRERKVIDERLEAFLVRHSWMRQRRVLGIHLAAVRDNEERVSALLGESETFAQSD